MPKVDSNDLAASTDPARFKETIKSLTAQAKAEQDEHDLGKPYDFDAMDSFDPENDPNCLIGKRWMCKGGSCIISADAGVGKSSFMAQAMVLWSCGKNLFGAQPSKPLKIAALQVENDNNGDMHEFMQGVLPGTGLINFKDHIKRNVFIYEVNPQGGGEWLYKSIKRLSAKHRGLDLIFIDPIFRFTGCSVSDQEKMTAFFAWIKKAQLETGVAVIFMHHNSKMKSNDGAQLDQASYFGSVELEAWPRATMAIKKIDNGGFELHAFKRGLRAGLTDHNGKQTLSVPIKYSNVGICWIRNNEAEQLHTPGTIELLWLPFLSKELWQTEEELKQRMKKVHRWSEDGWKAEKDKFKSSFNLHEMKEIDGIRDAGEHIVCRFDGRKMSLKLK